MGTGIGALLGLSAGLRPRSLAGWAGMLLGGIGPAVPAFLLAAVFAALMTDRSFTLVLAWTALAVAPAAQAARVARQALDGALDGNMIDGGAIFAARGRGLSNKAVLWHHAVPLGLAPVAGGLRSPVITVVAGAVAVEGLFALPGAGRLFLETMRAGDAGTAVAALAGLCGLTVLLNAAGAVLHGWFDPRFRTA
nr:ABC transporter permease subunit [Azospirillum soli]